MTLLLEKKGVKLPSKPGSPLGRGGSSSVLVWGKDSLGVESGVMATPGQVQLTPGGDKLPRLEIPMKGIESQMTLSRVREERGGGVMPPPGPLRPRRTKKRKTKRVDFGLGAIPDPPDRWGKNFENNESGGFQDAEPTNVKAARGGLEACGLIKGRVIASLKIVRFPELSLQKRVWSGLFSLTMFLWRLCSSDICDSFSSFKGLMRITMVLPDALREGVSPTSVKAYLLARKGYNQREKVIEPLLTEVREMMAGVALLRGGEALTGKRLVEAYNTAVAKVTQGAAELTRHGTVVLLCLARVMDTTAKVYVLCVGIVVCDPFIIVVWWTL